MEQKPHSIALERLMFVKSCVTAIQDFSPDDTTNSVLPINILDSEILPEQPGKWLSKFRLSYNADLAKNAPYCIDMECFCILSADESLSYEDAARGITITAHSVLYGAIREAVAWITARQPYGPLTLGLSVLQGNQKQ